MTFLKAVVSCRGNMSQMKSMKCLCMVQYTQCVPQAPFWKCFKEHFQLQKEKECLDGVKKNQTQQ